MTALYCGQAGRIGQLGKIAVAMASVGAGLLILGVSASRIGIIGDKEFRLLVPGLLSVIASSVLFALAAMQAGAFPRVESMLLIIRAATLITGSAEDARVWLGVPYGAAWTLLGYALWQGRVQTQHHNSGATLRSPKTPSRALRLHEGERR